LKKKREAFCLKSGGNDRLLVGCRRGKEKKRKPGPRRVPSKELAGGISTGRGRGGNRLKSKKILFTLGGRGENLAIPPPPKPQKKRKKKTKNVANGHHAQEKRKKPLQMRVMGRRKPKFSWQKNEKKGEQPSEGRGKRRL